MRQSRLYGYNFPLNWNDLMDKVKEAMQRQVEYELVYYEPFERDIPMLAKSDNIDESKVWGEIAK